MRILCLITLLSLLCTHRLRSGTACVRAQGIVIDLTGAGAGNHGVGACDSDVAVPDCSVHDGNQEFDVAPGGRYGVYFAWENAGAATFAEVRATDEMGNLVFTPVTTPLAPGGTDEITSFLSAPETPGFYAVLVTVTARDENDREDSRQFRYFITVDATLPVTWEDVRAEPLEKQTVDVHWEVSQETGNEVFLVERSHNGEGFTEVGAVAGGP